MKLELSEFFKLKGLLFLVKWTYKIHKPGDFVLGSDLYTEYTCFITERRLGDKENVFSYRQFIARLNRSIDTKEIPLSRTTKGTMGDFFPKENVTENRTFSLLRPNL